MVYKFLFIFIISFLMIGCSNENVTYKEISPEKAYQMIENNKEVFILDVRTSEEYETGHLYNSINIPLDSLVTSISDEIKDKAKTIIVYCKSGTRAIKASKVLVDLGYTNIYTFGGIDSWEGKLEKNSKKD